MVDWAPPVTRASTFFTLPGPLPRHLTRRNLLLLAFSGHGIRIKHDGCAAVVLSRHLRRQFRQIASFLASDEDLRRMARSSERDVTGRIAPVPRVKQADVVEGLALASIDRPRVSEFDRVEIGEIKFQDVAPESEAGHAALSPDGAHVAYLKVVRHTLRLVIVDVDRPVPAVVAGIPYPSFGPRSLTWADAGHVLVPQSAGGPLSFDLAGNRSQPDGKTHASTPADDARSIATDPLFAEIQTLAEGKLPDRKVVILGADEARRRFLLLVSGGAGSARYFGFDRPNDLLFPSTSVPSILENSATFRLLPQVRRE